MTESSLDAHDWVHLGGVKNTGTPSPSEAAALSGAWEEALASTLKPLHPGLKRLAAAGADVPGVGIELADDKGKVVADCELCWSAAKVVVLRADQEDLMEAWTAQGWKVLLLDEAEQMVDSTPWVEAAAEALGLAMNDKE